jgi:ssDNA-binding Zn-finger/Zn-ribbon topoisomerase 1
MRTLTNIPHKFDLNRLYACDTFLGCNNCWWRAERGEVMKPICPECGEQLYFYYVRKEDL